MHGLDWIGLEWWNLNRKDKFFSDAVHIGFFTRPGAPVSGLMMSGPQAGKHHLLGLDGKRKRGAITDKQL